MDDAGWCALTPARPPTVHRRPPRTSLRRNSYSPCSITRRIRPYPPIPPRPLLNNAPARCPGLLPSVRFSEPEAVPARMKRDRWGSISL